MDKKQTSIIIEAAGGDSAFARLLNIDEKPGFQQRVNNWKRRGMPSDVVLKNYKTINKLIKKAAEDRKLTDQKQAA